jgi:hypothetical protein
MSKNALIKKQKTKGRPKFTISDDQKERIGNLAKTLTQEQIADFLGIGRRTFIEMLNRDEKLSAHYKKGKSEAIAGVAGHLLKNCADGNVAAQIFFLKTQAGWSEQDTVKHHHTGEFGLIVHKLEDEDIIDLQDPKLIEGIDIEH